MFDQKNFTIVDVETTGGSPLFNRIIEIGLLRVENGQVVDEYQTLVNPMMVIPEYITKMTGIDDAQVEDAPSFAEIAGDIYDKFTDSIFVAHNAQFDYGFLKAEFRRQGLNLLSPQLCTVKLSRALYKEHKHHNLSAIIERFGFQCQNRHRAFDDAHVLWQFLQMLELKFSPSQLQHGYKMALSKLPKKLLENT